MEVTEEVVRLRGDLLITNISGDTIHIGEYGSDQDNWFPLEVGSGVSIEGAGEGIGVVSDGVSEVGILPGGTGIFPPAVEAPDLSGYQPLDSDLTAIAALSTTSYGRGLLVLANAAAADWMTDAEVAAGYQPLDSDLTAIAALSTTSYGRGLLALANAAAAEWVAKALYDANTILAATTDNTPAALTVAASTIVGRKSSGDISAMSAAEAAAVLGTNIYGQVQTLNPQTGTTYTLVAADAGKLVTLSNASAITLTVPQDSDATIAIGTYVDLYQLGAGQVTVVAGSGATLRVSGLTAKARAQYSRLAVQKVSANTWSLLGDLAAS